MFHSPSSTVTMKPDTWRIVLFGDGGVGKSALAVQVGAISCRISLGPEPTILLQYSLGHFGGQYSVLILFQSYVLTITLILSFPLTEV